MIMIFLRRCTVRVGVADVIPAVGGVIPAVIVATAFVFVFALALRRPWMSTVFRVKKDLNRHCI